MQIRIIYTETKMLLSKNFYESWREIQQEYEAYKVSLGPWEHGEIIEYLADEYPDLCPSAHEQVAIFLTDECTVKALTFKC